MEKKKHDVSKCLDKIRKEIIKADPAVKMVWFDLSTIVDLNERPKKIYKTGQRVTVVSDKIKKDGAKKEVHQKTFVTHDYCPFCGTKF